MRRGPRTGRCGRLQYWSNQLGYTSPSLGWWDHLALQIDSMTLSDWGHLGLDALGFIPVLGALPDAINAAWYWSEGNYAEAAQSGLAAIPFYGDVTAGVAKVFRRGAGVAEAVQASARVLNRGVNLGQAGYNVSAGLQSGNVVQAGLGLVGGALNARAGKAAGVPGKAATSSVGDLRRAGQPDAHHVIQDAAVRNLPGYNTNAAPGVRLNGPPNVPGTPHHATRAVQRQSGGGTYAAERRIGYKALRRAGQSPDEARRAIEEADEYFRGIGVEPRTPTKIPGDRR